MKIAKTLDQAVEALNESAREFVHHSDRMRRISELEAENKKLKALLEESDELYERCKRNELGWQELYEQKKQELITLQKNITISKTN